MEMKLKLNNFPMKKERLVKKKSDKTVCTFITILKSSGITLRTGVENISNLDLISVTQTFESPEKV